MEKKSATEVGRMFGYSKAAVYSLARDFKKRLLSGESSTASFFNDPSRGRRPSPGHDDLREFIILLRKKYRILSIYPGKPIVSGIVSQKKYPSPSTRGTLSSQPYGG